MRALTVRQPWAWAILHAGKDVENRSWLPSESLFGQRIALHASSALDPHARRGYFQITGQRAPDDLPRGVVLGSVELAGWVGEDGSCSDPGLLVHLKSRWFVGPYGWVLRDPRPAPSLVECRGALGLWKLPEGLAL